MVQYPLLVQVNEYPAVDRIPNSGAPDFARLEYHVAVRQDDRPAQAAQMIDGRQCSRIDQVRKRVLQQILRQVQQLRIAVEPGAKRLQTTQVIGDPKFFAKSAKDRPIALATAGAERQLQSIAEIRAESVVVEQGVVDIQQEDDAVGQHGEVASGFGSCQVSSPPITLAAVAGPQLPGW